MANLGHQWLDLATSHRMINIGCQVAYFYKSKVLKNSKIYPQSIFYKSKELKTSKIVIYLQSIFHVHEPLNKLNSRINVNN